MLHRLDLSRTPSLIEPRLKRTVEAQQSGPALAGMVCTQLFSLPTGALGPK
jgi:hypothetical protein